MSHPVAMIGAMGYGGKWQERARARELRAHAWTLQEIATELGVSKSSVSTWVRDVSFTPQPRHRGHRAMKPHPANVRKLAEIEQCDHWAAETIGTMSERDLLVLGAALYLGEGFKTDGGVGMANTDGQVLALFVTWLRRFFAIDESRLRVRLYLHDGLDLLAAERHWSELLDIPCCQFRKAYRAVADPSRRRAKHEFGCPAVTYSCVEMHRRVMGLVRAITSTAALPG